MENFSQNQNQPNSSQNPTEGMNTATTTSQPKKGGLGSILTSIVVIIILLVGGLFVWGHRLTNEEKTITPAEEAGEATNINESAEISSEDDLSTLEEELNATEIEATENFDYSLDVE